MIIEPLKAYAGYFLLDRVWVHLSDGYMLFDGVILKLGPQPAWLATEWAVSEGVLVPFTSWDDKVDEATAELARDVGLVGTLMSDIVALDGDGLPVGLRPPGPPLFWTRRQSHSSAN